MDNERPIEGRLYFVTDGRETYVARRGIVMWRILTARPFNFEPFLQDEDVRQFELIALPPWTPNSAAFQECGAWAK